MDWSVIQALAIALGLGLLVGLEREWAGRHLVGIRTFSLLSTFGALIGLLTNELGPWFAAAGLLAVGAVLVAGYVIRSHEPDRGTGLTTAAAALVMTAAGIAIGLGHVGAGLFVGGATAVLLSWKERLHGVVKRIGQDEIRAIIRMSLIALIVLPILPDRSFGPYDVLNPYEIWLVVVLICGISLGSYLAYRFLGERAGTLLGGVLGGLISSTATTVSHARAARRWPDTSPRASAVIIIASTVMFFRVFAEVAVIAPGVLPGVGPPIGLMAAAMALICVIACVRSPTSSGVPIPSSDPLELKSAIFFGLMFLTVLLAVAIVKEHLGDDALYGVAAVSGLTDVDAITLSTAQMIEKGKLDVDVGWRMILIGAMSNLLFKAVVVAVLGSPRTARPVAAAFGASLVGGALLLALWP